MPYEEKFTLAERYEHLETQHREDLETLRRYTRALGRVLGPQKCPICGNVLRFYPEPSVADPSHIMLYACPTPHPALEMQGWKGTTHYSIGDFTEEMVGKDVPVPPLSYTYKKIEVLEDYAQ